MGLRSKERKTSIIHLRPNMIGIWEMAAFPLGSRMSMAMIDYFLKLGPVSTSMQLECPEII